MKGVLTLIGLWTLIFILMVANATGDIYYYPINESSGNASEMDFSKEDIDFTDDDNFSATSKYDTYSYDFANSYMGVLPDQIFDADVENNAFMCMWIWYYNTTSDDEALIRDNNGEFYIRIKNDDTLRIEIWLDGAVVGMSGSDPVPADEWVQVCGGWYANDEDIILIINNDTDKSYGQAGKVLNFSSGQEFGVGAWYGNNIPFDGLIDDLAFTDESSIYDFINQHYIGNISNYTASTPETPAQLDTPSSLTNTTQDNESITISWSGVDDAEKYLIYNFSVNFWNDTSSPYQITGLNNNTEYCLNITAYNVSLTYPESNFSNTICVYTEQNAGADPPPPAVNPDLVMNITCNYTMINIPTYANICNSHPCLLNISDIGELSAIWNDTAANWSSTFANDYRTELRSIALGDTNPASDDYDGSRSVSDPASSVYYNNTDLSGGEMAELAISMGYVCALEGNTDLTDTCIYSFCGVCDLTKELLLQFNNTPAKATASEIWDWYIHEPRRLNHLAVAFDLIYNTLDETSKDLIQTRLLEEGLSAYRKMEDQDDETSQLGDTRIRYLTGMALTGFVLDKDFLANVSYCQDYFSLDGGFGCDGAILSESNAGGEFLYNYSLCYLFGDEPPEEDIANDVDFPYILSNFDSYGIPAEGDSYLSYVATFTPLFLVALNNINPSENYYLEGWFKGIVEFSCLDKLPADTDDGGTVYPYERGLYGSKNGEKFALLSFLYPEWSIYNYQWENIRNGIPEDASIPFYAEAFSILTRDILNDWANITAPTDISYLYDYNPSENGISFMRQGFTGNESYVATIFNYRGGGDKEFFNQGDFSLISDGKYLIAPIDSGDGDAISGDWWGSYPDPDNSRATTCQTMAARTSIGANTYLIDGYSTSTEQTYKIDEVEDPAYFEDNLQQANIGFMRGNVSYGGVSALSEDVLLTRSFLYPNRDYLIVVDSLDGSSELHNYTLSLNLGQTSSGSTLSTSNKYFNYTEGGVTLHGYAASDITLGFSSYVHDCGVKGVNHYQIKSYSASNSIDNHRVYLFLPRNSTETTPEINDLSSGNDLKIETIIGTSNETVNYDKSSGVITFSAYTSDSLDYSFKYNSSGSFYSETEDFLTGVTEEGTPDLTAPTILTISNTTTNETASITWTTNETSNYTMLFNGVNYNGTSYVTTFEQNITGLTNNTLYYYNITSCDSLGNCDTSTNYYLTTLNNNWDSNPPLILTISNTSTNQTATITWTTNETANYTILFNGVNYNTTDLNASYTKLITGLINATTYYYNITSCDSSANCNTSINYFVTTAANALPPAAVAEATYCDDINDALIKLVSYFGIIISIIILIIILTLAEGLSKGDVNLDIIGLAFGAFMVILVLSIAVGVALFIINNSFCG